MNKLMSAYRVSSLESLNRTSREDAKLAEERTLEFANMLDRIDTYTSGKYSAAVEKFKNKLLFSLYLYLGDREELKNILICAVIMA